MKSVINTKLSAYIILVLQTVYFSWNWFFLLFATISLSGIKYGGIITGILFLSNAVVRMLGANYFAALSKKYTEIGRFYCSLGTRLAFLSLLALLTSIANHSFYLITWVFISNILLVIDGYMIFDLKYYFADSKYISLMRYNTLGNLGSRGLIAAASIVAVLLGKDNWSGLMNVCFFLTFLGVVASCITVIYAIQHKNVTIIKPVHIEQINLDNYAQNTAKLGAFYLFLMNLCFGAGALLLTRAVFEYDLIIHNSLNIVTFFYVGFIAINVLSTIFDDLCNVLITWKRLIASYFVTAAMASLFFILRNHSGWCFTLSMIWGIAYGWSLIAFFPLIVELIRGQNQTKLFAKIDSASRFGFILSQLITGFLLDASIDPFQLLQIYSLFAILSLIASLIFYRKKLLGVLCYEHATE